MFEAECEVEKTSRSEIGGETLGTSIRPRATPPSGEGDEHPEEGGRGDRTMLSSISATLRCVSTGRAVEVTRSSSGLSTEPASV
jgi:hypothetical protein